MTIPIWSDDTGNLDAILAEAKTDAINHLHDNEDTSGDWLVDDILDKAHAAGGDPETAIRDLTIDDVPVDIYNHDQLGDEQANLDAIPLERDVVVTGTAGLWDGPHTMTAHTGFDTIGDILRDLPWPDMDENTWTIDDNDDLRYTGVHHDGVNTCIYRQIKPHTHMPADPDPDTIHTLTDPLGPLIRHLYGIPDPTSR